MSAAAPGKIYRDTLVVVALAGAGKLISLGRESVVSAAYGVSSVTDAYFTAYNIPTVLFTAVAASVPAVFLPFYARSLAEGGDGAASEFASKVVNLYVLVAVAMTLAGIALAPQIVALIAPTFDARTAALATGLTRVLFTSFAFSITASVMMAMENARRSFVGPQLAPIVNNLFVAAAVLLLAGSHGIFVVAWAAVAGWVIQIPIQALFLRGRFSWRPRLGLRDPSLAAMGAMIVPVLAGTTVNQVNVVVDTTIASRLDVGSISALNYANRLLNVMSGVLVLATTTVVFSVFAEMAAKNEIDRLKHAVRTCVMTMVVLLLPVAVVCVVHAADIVGLVFERGAFGEGATRLTAAIFALYALGMVPYALREVLTRVLYALRDSRTPMVNGAVAVALNVALSLLLVGRLKAPGLALSAALSGVVACVLLGVALRRKVGSFAFGSLGPQLVRVGVGAALMLAVVLAVRAPLAGAGRLVRLAAGSSFGALAYFAALWALGVPAVREGAGAIGGWLGRGVRTGGRGR